MRMHFCEYETPFSILLIKFAPVNCFSLLLTLKPISIMKKIFLFTVALLGAITMKAQETDAMSATLQSGETTTVYSGADAFKNALAAAEDGSVITLSSGTFNDPGAFTKSVKVYGAGFQDDEETGVKSTRVLSGVSIRKDDEGKFHDNLRLEGIWFTGGVSIENVEGEILTGLQVVKCHTGGIDFNGATQSTLLLQSYIEGALNGRGQTASNLLVQNCYVAQHVTNFGGASDVLVDHCILARDNSGAYDQYHGPYTYRYTIIDIYLQAGATANYCLGYEGYFTDKVAASSSNCYYHSVYKDWATLFKDAQNNLRYTLTDTNTPRTWEFAEPDKYLGDDGTPVGVTGGDYPWNPIPSTPRIVSSSIDSKSVAGKLKVNIKAEARPVNK